MGPLDHRTPRLSSRLRGGSQVRYVGAIVLNGPVKTIQPRRYTLVDGAYDAFVEWHGAMPAIRPTAGFAIEFARPGLS